MNKSVLIAVVLVGAMLSALSAASQETGIAEVYFSDDLGKITASGAAYNPQKFTAAHKMHPMGTQIKVTRTDEPARRSVIVTINDRGPYTSGHIVQLSKAAGRRIGIDEGNTASVEIMVISKENPKPVVVKNENSGTATPNVNTAPKNPGTNSESTTNPLPASKPAPAAAANPASTPSDYSQQPKPAQGPAMVQVDEKAYPLVRNDYKAFGLYKIALHHASNQGYGVQVVSLNKPDNLLQQIAGLQSKWFDNILVSVEPGADGKTPLYKLVLGPFATEEQARNYANNLKKKYKMTGFVIDMKNIQYGQKPTSP